MIDSVVFAVPLEIMQISLDYLVHVQYQFTDQFTLGYLASTALPRLMAWVMFVHFTNRHAKSIFMQFFIVVTAAISSMFLIHYSKEDETFGSMKKTPGLAVLWIYCTMQMDLKFIVISLVFPLAYYYKKEIMSFKNAAAHLEL